MGGSRRRGGGPIDSEERAAREAKRARRAEALAQRVRALRGWGDYTLDQLSERSGLSRQYLSDLERGKRPRPRPETLARLAEALGVTVRQLRGCEPLTAPASETEAEAAAGPEPPAEPTPPEPPDPPALGLTSFLTLPPGAVLLHETKPDGSVTLYIRIPGGPGECGRNPPATPEG
jgi:transcriptional regulator with XRE-family HTH domain